VARRERHLVQLADIPRRYDVSARVRIVLQTLDQLCDLIDVPATREGPRAPLAPVHRSEIAGLVRPLIPDRHAVLVQIADIGVAGEKPQKLVDNRLEMQLLGSQQRKAAGQIKAHLMAENGERPGPGPVGFLDAVLAHAAKQVQIVAH
jgi:hypothetical protein